MTHTTIVTTCKGHTKELAVALETWLSGTPFPIVITLDGCPDFRSRDFHPENPRIRFVYTSASTSHDFSKPRALNAGALAVKTDRILFLDSDTLVMHGFSAWHERVVAEKPTAMLMVPARKETADLTGALGVSTEDFFFVDGADEGFVGWGAEDLDLRLRIFLARTPRVVSIPNAFFESIPHSDEQRTRYYTERNKLTSNAANMQRLVNNAERLTGQSIFELLEHPMVRKLFVETL